MIEESTDGGGSFTMLSISMVEQRVDQVLLNLYLPTFIKSIMTVTAVFAYVIFFV